MLKLKTYCSHKMFFLISQPFTVMSNRLFFKKAQSTHKSLSQKNYFFSSVMKTVHSMLKRLIVNTNWFATKPTSREVTSGNWKLYLVGMSTPTCSQLDEIYTQFQLYTCAGVLIIFGCLAFERETITFFHLPSIPASIKHSVHFSFSVLFVHILWSLRIAFFIFIIWETHSWSKGYV